MSWGLAAQGFLETKGWGAAYETHEKRWRVHSFHHPHPLTFLSLTAAYFEEQEPHRMRQPESGAGYQNLRQLREGAATLVSGGGRR